MNIKKTIGYIVKVRVNSKYKFQPVPYDRINPPINSGLYNINSGDIVKVVNINGCPKANTMGMCYIETL